MHPCKLYHQKHKTLKIGLNDDALKAFLTKIVRIGKCYSVVYVIIIVYDQLIRKKKKFLFHLIDWNGNKIINFALFTCAYFISFDFRFPSSCIYCCKNQSKNSNNRHPRVKWKMFVGKIRQDNEVYWTTGTTF